MLFVKTSDLDSDAAKIVQVYRASTLKRLAKPRRPDKPKNDIFTMDSRTESRRG